MPPRLPPKLTNLPPNVFLDHIAPRLTTRNVARLNSVTRGQIPGLAEHVKKLDDQRKQAAISVVKRQQHDLARRIVLAIKGIRMSILKKRSTNDKNQAWINQYKHLYTLIGQKDFQYRGLGGPKITIWPDWNMSTWYVRVIWGKRPDRITTYDTYLKAKGTKLTFRKDSVKIVERSAQTNWYEYHLRTSNSRRYAIRALITPVMKEVVTMWNTPPITDRLH